MLRIVSTTTAYRRLAAVASGPEREAAWVEQYETAHPSIFAIYYSGYGDSARRRTACDRVDVVLTDLDAREARMLRELRKAHADFAGLGLIPSGTALDVVLMVGVGASDAWVDILRGRPTLFVALEMLRHPPADSLLAVHELIHVAHLHALWSRFGAEPELRNHVGMRVWAEGLAVAGTRVLRPGHDNAAYLFADTRDWVRDCERHAPQIFSTIRARVDEIDPAIAYALCGVTDQQPWPSRAGYWAGDRAVRHYLTAGRTLRELLSWDIDQVVEALASFSNPAVRRTSPA